MKVRQSEDTPRARQSTAHAEYGLSIVGLPKMHHRVALAGYGSTISTLGRPGRLLRSYSVEIALSQKVDIEEMEPRREAIRLQRWGRCAANVCPSLPSESGFVKKSSAPAVLNKA